MEKYRDLIGYEPVQVADQVMRILSDDKAYRHITDNAQSQLTFQAHAARELIQLIRATMDDVREATKIALKPSTVIPIRQRSTANLSEVK